MSRQIDPQVLVAQVRLWRERHGDERYVRTLSQLPPVCRLSLLLFEARADLDEVLAVLAMTFVRQESPALWAQARVEAEKVFTELLPEVRAVLDSGAGSSITLGEIAYRTNLRNLPLTGQIIALMFEAADGSEIVIDFLACLHLVQAGLIPLEDHRAIAVKCLLIYLEEIIKAFDLNAG